MTSFLQVLTTKLKGKNHHGSNACYGFCILLIFGCFFNVIFTICKRKPAIVERIKQLHHYSNIYTKSTPFRQ